MLQTTGARSAFKLGTGHMIAPALGSMAACFSYFMRFVIGKFHANLFAQCSLSLALGMCSGIAEPQWWRGRLSCQRNLPRRPRRTNPPQVRVPILCPQNESVLWIFLNDFSFFQTPAVVILAVTQTLTAAAAVAAQMMRMRKRRKRRKRRRRSDTPN